MKQFLHSLDVVFLVLLDTPEVPWLEDFEPYYAASVQLLDGASPYTAEQLGAPIDAVCPGCYLYPPFLAQLITPLTLVSMDTAKIKIYGSRVKVGLSIALSLPANQSLPHPR